MSKQLTKIQVQILDFLISEKSCGKTPTLSEIAKKFGYNNRSTVQQHISALEKKGFLKRNPNLSRNIELNLEDKFFIPRPVLGEVAAGTPLTIYPDAIDTIELPTIAHLPKDSFLLRVKGDSLKDAYIFSGDVVIVNPNMLPQNGQIAAAILEDAAVVKRFQREDDTIKLLSENPEYAPIVINKDNQKFKIVGVVIGIYRSMEKNIV
ncbi:MAG: transcriptional repressor LexA [Bacteroidota bacterium]|nr:transcriptional repressor LexA [Bacteroidota bacterium]